ncbi:MAG: DUF4003 family protein [Clostridia bacterium]|nr:DUF4003 family protein [Clostridia bacterium]
MKPELEKRCAEFIANRDTVQKAFRWDDGAIHSLCANIFCACGRMADAERLKACGKVIEGQTGLFSKFRGKTRPILCSMLALADDPEERMALANEYYNLLRQEFKDTEYLALAAFLLTGLGERNRMAEKIVRGKELYRRMDKEHPILTDNTDSVFAVMLAFSEKPDDELIGDVDACYQALTSRFSKGAAQTSAQILAMAAGASGEKTQRMFELYDALLAADISYGKSRELAPLAALSLADASVPALVEEICEADEYLKGQKGYGSRKEDREKRAMHAVMIVSTQYAGAGLVNSSVMANTLDMLIEKQIAMYVSLISNAVQFAASALASLQESKDEKEEETGEGTGDESQPGE